MPKGRKHKNALRRRDVFPPLPRPATSVHARIKLGIHQARRERHLRRVITNPTATVLRPCGADRHNTRVRVAAGPRVAPWPAEI
jgi:hypothetical protein